MLKIYLAIIWLGIHTLFSLPGVNTIQNDRKQPNHAIYIAIVELHHEENSDEALLQVKVFTDDLEAALTNKYGQQVVVEKNIVTSATELKIQGYFKDHLKISVNNQLLSGNFSKITRETDAHWLYFHVKCPKKWLRLEMKADFFMELFPTQSNIFQVQTGENKRYYRFTNKENAKSFTFDH